MCRFVPFKKNCAVKSKLFKKSCVVTIRFIHWV